MVSEYRPNLTLTGAEDGEALPLAVPLLEGRGAPDGGSLAYVCRSYACRAPTSDPDEVAAELSRGGSADATGET